MQLAGAKIDRETFEAECLIYPNPRTCGLSDELGLSQVQTAEANDKDLSDPRIQRVVSLDLGLARSFSVQSLNEINVPTLILAAGIDIGDLPQALASGYMAEHIPLSSRQYKVYENATHFSFIQPCKSGAEAMLKLFNTKANHSVTHYGVGNITVNIEEIITCKVPDHALLKSRLNHFIRRKPT